MVNYSIQNVAIEDLENLFMNNAFTLQEYEAQLNAKKDEYNTKLKDKWYKFFHGKSAKENIEWINRLKS